MHAHEIPTSVDLVRRLIARQFPAWAALPITPLDAYGTGHVIYRLGDALTVRLPRIADSVAQAEKERRWLPYLAPHLPLTIPAPVAFGQPDAGYPLAWSVYRWIDGENATPDRLRHPTEAARVLGGFVRALQAVDATDAPRPGAHNFGRGVPLAERDAATRAAIDQLHGQIDTRAALSVWAEALAAPVWTGAPQWIHGDLQAGNLLAQDGRLHAVIDFGGLGAGDPACDLQPAWNLFDGAARAAFRSAVGLDDAAWVRGRGWSLSVAVIALPYYHQTNPQLAAIARRTIAAVLADGTWPPPEEV
jgi:aminoglycoside phosphotransferase (APT) family kinase protein